MITLIKKSFERLQKVAVLGLCVVAVVYSCGKRIETGGEVPYKDCPCDEEKPLWEEQRFPRGEAYLFKDYIPEQMNNYFNDKMSSVPFPNICYIVYNSETDVATIGIANLDRPETNIMFIGQICNYPDFAKEWDIHENGIKIIIEGRMYRDCRNHYSYYVPFDYILTSLKRK